MPQRRVFVTDASAILQDALIVAVQTIQTAQALTPLTILVPNHSVAVQLRHAIAWAGRGHCGLQFSTLLGFARDCALDSLIQAGMQPLSPLAAPLVVSNIIQKLLREARISPVFASSSRQSRSVPEAASGFARVFLETLADCQQAGIFPDHLRTFIERAQLTDQYRNKIDSIATLYAHYRGFLSEHQLYDDNTLFERAALLLEAQSDNIFTDDTLANDAFTSPLFIYGFEKFSPTQRRLLTGAIRGQGGASARDVLVFFPWRDGSAYESATPSLSWLRNLGLQYTPLTPTAEYRNNQSHEGFAEGESASRAYKNGLTRVQLCLFEEMAYAGENPGQNDRSGSDGLLDNSVICFTAPGRSREVREIGRTILGLVRDHDVCFSEIGILLPDIVNYGSIVLETLSGFDIPCFMAGGLPLLQTSTGQALRLLCRLLAEDYTRPCVFEFLSVSNPPYATLLEKKYLRTIRGQNLDDISADIRPDRWEEFSRQAGIVSGAEGWQTRLAQLEKHYQREAQSKRHTDAPNQDDLNVLRAFVVFMQDFFDLAERQSGLHTWRGWAEYTLRLCQTYVMPGPETADVEETLLRLSQLDLMQENCRRRDIPNNHPASRLEDKHEPASPVTREDWIGAVSNALATTTSSTKYCDPQGVFVGDVSAARGVRFRALLVPGLIDGNFPRPVRQDPLLLDAERQHLAETVGCEIRQRSQQNEDDRVLFSLIAHSATDHLILSYPSQDQAGGHAHMPSWYLLRVLEALRGTPQTFADLESWCRQVPLVPVYASPSDKAPHILGTPEPLDIFEFHLSNIERAVATGNVSPLGYLPRLAPAFLHARQANVQRWEQDRLTPFEGMLESPKAQSVVRQRLFPTGIVVSASALETYARCPFGYFLTSVLGLEPRGDPAQVLALRPQDRGLLLHDILHDFFSQLQTAGQLPVADLSGLADQDSHSVSQRLIQTAEKHFTHFAETHLTGFALLWELEKERMHERLALLLKRERQMGAEFLPEAFEAHFGLGMSQHLTERMPGATNEEVLESRFFPEIPVQFELEDGEIIGLRGRIDRIDLSTGDQPRARIIDYKTGKLPRGQFAKGMVLQLPLYLFAAQTLRPELTWESAEYVGVDGSQRNIPAAFTAQTWPEVLRTLRQIVTIVVTGVRTGCFFPQPDTCYPCPFPEICGSQVNKQMMRKRNDPRLLAFRQLRSIP